LLTVSGDDKAWRGVYEANFGFWVSMFRPLERRNLSNVLDAAFIKCKMEPFQSFHNCCSIARKSTVYVDEAECWKYVHTLSVVEVGKINTLVLALPCIRKPHLELIHRVPETSSQLCAQA
jgi:hypothetical protein